MKERLFIAKSKEHVKLEEFVRKQFAQAKCGSIEVQYTPVVTRIILHTTTPGLIIGSGGERIKETVELIKKEFKIDNPQIDVQRIEDPDIDPIIIAQTLAASIESGVNFKKLGNFYLQRIMEAGAIGCEIVLSGKISGQRGRRERFVAGYLKKCGEPAKRDVLKGFAVANPKLGNIGITVKIMLKRTELSMNIKKPEAPKEEPKAEKEAPPKEPSKEEPATEQTEQIVNEEGTEE
ncbi:MAG: small subunit ribosomal protein S3 [archaeon GW2011_AR5]|nr:small subunit ribosomal protein S3 [uncultured archaeon]KHO48302.1 MAG: small subunit ribosomal protein S3 [archaeon GW2011_AR5]